MSSFLSIILIEGWDGRRVVRMISFYFCYLLLDAMCTESGHAADSMFGRMDRSIDCVWTILCTLLLVFVFLCFQGPLGENGLSMRAGLWCFNRIIIFFSLRDIETGLASWLVGCQAHDPTEFPPAISLSINLMPAYPPLLSRPPDSPSRVVPSQFPGALLQVSHDLTSRLPPTSRRLSSSTSRPLTPSICCSRRKHYTYETLKYADFDPLDIVYIQ